MSTLQVANLHLESTGNNRIQNINSTSFAIVAGGTTVITANSTSAAIAGGIVANGSVGTAGQVLLSGGSGANAYWGGSAGYVMQTYTSNSTWTKPDNLKAVKVTVVGGGGGVSGNTPSPLSIRGGAAGGGGASIGYIPAPSIPGPVVITVGLGGVNSNPATTGGTSSFGAFLSATGGSTGQRWAPTGAGGEFATTVANGGAGGIGTGGSYNISGEAGERSTILEGNSGFFIITAGKGGNSLLGYGGESNLIKDNASNGPTGISNPGTNYGGGASGYNQGSSGPSVARAANGAPGIVIVEEFY